MAGAEPQRNSSRTALSVAASRAVHQFLDGEPKILDDPIAAACLTRMRSSRFNRILRTRMTPWLEDCAPTWFCEAAMRKNAWPRQ